MIEIQGVHKSFGDLHVLKGIDLEVKKGEVVSVIGGSGSGKSTLLYCINAIEKIQQGKIIVDGVDVHHKQTNQDKLRQKLGIPVLLHVNQFVWVFFIKSVLLTRYRYF